MLFFIKTLFCLRIAFLVFSRSRTLKTKHDRKISNLQSNFFSAPSSVAFTYKIYDDTDEIAVGDTVKFDTQIFDNTGSFDPSTGEFTAPSCGMYVFMLNIRSNQGKVCWIDIIKDGGERLATAFAQSSDKVHDGDSTFLTIYLKEGDKVWTKNHGYQGTVCTIDFDSSFAGFRLN